MLQKQKDSPWCRAGAGGCLDQDQILILYILLRTFRISQTHDALSACIPGDGVDQHGGGWQGGADEGGAAAKLRGHGHDPHEHRTQGGAHMEHGGVVWWLQIKYDNKNKQEKKFNKQSSRGILDIAVCYTCGKRGWGQLADKAEVGVHDSASSGCRWSQ